MEHVNQTSTQPRRRRDLDLMGALVVLGLIFFHTARIFDTNAFHVKNEPTSQVVDTLVFFISLWGMPLLFLIAGMNAWHSLRRRAVGEFVRERFRRLFIPYVVGLLVIVPPQVYFRLQNIPEYDDSYFQFLRHFFDVRLAFYFPQFITDAPPYWLFKPGHLWFLNYLFVYTLLLLPLFLYLRRPAGRRLVERLAVLCSRRWAVLGLAIPFGVIEAALQTETGPGGWNRYAYLPFVHRSRRPVCQRSSIALLCFASNGHCGDRVLRGTMAHQRTGQVPGDQSLLPGSYAGSVRHRGQANQADALFVRHETNHQE